MTTESTTPLRKWTCKIHLQVSLPPYNHIPHRGNIPTLNPKKQDHVCPRRLISRLLISTMISLHIVSFQLSRPTTLSRLNVPLTVKLTTHAGYCTWGFEWLPRGFDSVTEFCATRQSRYRATSYTGEVQGGNLYFCRSVPFTASWKSLANFLFAVLTSQ